MTRDEFKILVKGLKAVYTQPSFIPDKEAFEVWYGLLADLDYGVASNAIKKHMQTEENVPTIASIRKQASSLHDCEDELNEMAAWQMVVRAIRNSSYHAEEEFAKLPPLVKKAVVSSGQLHEWAIAEDVDGTWMNVTQSNFLRTYRAEAVREKELRRLSPELLKLSCKPSPRITEAFADSKALSVREEWEQTKRMAVPLPERLVEKYAELIRTLG